MNAHKVQVIRYRHRLGHHKPYTGQLTLRTKCKSLADQVISNFREGRYKHIVKCVCVCVCVCVCARACVSEVSSVRLVCTEG